MMRIAITGASGFVGKALVARLADRVDVRVTGLVRRMPADFPAGSECVTTGGLEGEANWRKILAGFDVLVHAAGRAHVMRETVKDPVVEFRRINVEGTLSLAVHAAAAGVRRLVFVSSVKVNGESTQPGRPYVEEDAPAPLDAYGISKREAEDGLRKISSDTGMEVVVVRPPLVYGHEVKGNFANMMRWVGHGLPLPLGAITENRRSFVALDNLVDLLITCAEHPAARNQTFLVSDGEDLSTADLLVRLGRAMGRQTRLLHVPEKLLKVAAHAMGRAGIYSRLCGSLQVDITKARQLLNWAPSLSVNEGLLRAAQGFKRVPHV